MCIIEFVDFNETYTFGREAAAPVAEEAKPKTRRSRKKSSETEEGAEKKSVKAAAPKATAAKASAAKGAKKTNVGKKM
jgi:hypothetical protein